jgi:hypothetical protein
MAATTALMDSTRLPSRSGCCYRPFETTRAGVSSTVASNERIPAMISHAHQARTTRLQAPRTRAGIRRRPEVRAALSRCLMLTLTIGVSDAQTCR